MTVCSHVLKLLQIYKQKHIVQLKFFLETYLKKSNQDEIAFLYTTAKIIRK